MTRTKPIGLTLVALVLMLGACSTVDGATESPSGDTALGSASADADTSDVSDQESDTTTTTSVVSTGQAASSVANQESHYEDGDLTWDAASEIAISLDGSTATGGTAVTVDGSTVTVSAPGTYRLSGQLTGQILIDSAADGIVRLILDGVAIDNPSGSAIAAVAADEVVLVLADGTENVLSDGASYTFPDADTDEPNATLYSASDLTIGGSGALTVNGAYNDAVASKDGLVIVSGTLLVDAVDDGIRGKDYVIVHDASIAVTSGGDGIKADNDEDADRGYVLVAGGDISIDAGGDGIDAASDVDLTGGSVSITTADGASGSFAQDASAKGVKGDVSVTIDGVDLSVDAADDAVHSNGTITVRSGVVTAATGDDGFHADAELTILGGSITITESYEGLESLIIRIADGEIDITADDDGINIAGGVDVSGTGGRPGRGGGPDQFAALEGAWLYIEGGTVTIDADGDGLDSNGSVEMTGGTVVVDGPTGNMNGAIDVNGSFALTGGVLAASGSAGMAETPDTGQAMLGIVFNNAIDAGTLMTVEDGSGDVVLALLPPKTYQAVVISTPEIVAGATYTVLLGGTASGSETAGLYLDATVSSATVAGTLSAS